MPNEIGTMTDCNYTTGYVNNYNGDNKMNAPMTATMATPHKSTQSRRSLRRLKKSYSECEYDDMDPDFVMTSPTKRPYIEQGQSINPKPTILKHNSYPVNDGIAETNLQYQQDQLKSQYLLQQQQKLKEFKKDPNYNVADNYSSESSNDNRMNNKSCGTNSNTNSLRRKKGLSTSSLCICDADTEVKKKMR